MRNFGEFFNNQVAYAGAIILSRTDLIDEQKAEQCREMLREINKAAAIVTTPIEKLDGAKILDVMEHPISLQEELLAEEVCPVCGHDHEHHHDHEHCHDHEHHHDHEHCHDHEHHHDYEHCHDHEHHHDHEHCHDHEHHHDHEHCHDHEHEHHHDHEHCGHDHHHHHADEVFTSWGRETVKKYTKEQLQKILDQLSKDEKYGIILRAKGMLPGEDGTWIYFDMVPEETQLREGAPEYTGRLCVIGSKLKEDQLSELFGL